MEIRFKYEQKKSIELHNRPRHHTYKHTHAYKAETRIHQNIVILASKRSSTARNSTNTFVYQFFRSFSSLESNSLRGHALTLGRIARLYHLLEYHQCNTCDRPNVRYLQFHPWDCNGRRSGRVGRFSRAIIQITWRLDSLSATSGWLGWFTVDHHLSLSLSLCVRVVVVPSQIQVRLHGFHYKSTPTYVISPSPFNPLTFDPRFHDPLYHSVPPSCADHGRALPSARAKETS